jgi:hypothetical protein
MNDGSTEGNRMGRPLESERAKGFDFLCEDNRR